MKALAVLLPALCSILAVRWIFFKILKIAKDYNIVDNPDARKLQKVPIPVMGGIAVFFGVICGLLVSTVTWRMVGMYPACRMVPIFAGMSVMLYTGAIDDILGIKPSSRIVIEVLTILGLIYGSNMCIDTLHGLWGIQSFSWWIGVPLTVFAGVGIINAINMIDGVNGLSSGLCITCSLLFGVVFYHANDVRNACLAFVMAFSLIPFYVHNVFGVHSRMFIGDAGTMVMGIVMTWFTINMLASDSPTNETPYFTNATDINAIALALAIMSVPIADTLRVMTMRILKKQSPFHPDKTHLHHAFVTVGMSHLATSVSEILIDLMTVCVWAVSLKLEASLEMQLYLVIVTAMIFVWGTYIILRYHAVHHTKFLHRITHVTIRTNMTHKQWWVRLSEYLDAPEYQTKIADIQKANTHLNRKYVHLSPEQEYHMNADAVISFMKGRAEVYVEDIERNSGVEPDRVMDILRDQIAKGMVTVIRRNEAGQPDIVTTEVMS